jgi:hypothetical protein
MFCFEILLMFTLFFFTESENDQQNAADAMLPFTG